MATYAQRAERLRDLVLTMRPDLADASEAIEAARLASFTGSLEQAPYRANGHGVPRYNYVNLGVWRTDDSVRLSMSVFADENREPAVHMAWVDGKQTGDYDEAMRRFGTDPKALARSLVDPSTALRLAYASRVEWALKAAASILATIKTWERYPRTRYGQRQLALAERSAPGQLRELIEAEAAYRALTPTT